MVTSPRAVHVVYAAGGHATVVADAIIAGGGDVIAFVDDAPAMQGRAVLGIPVRSREWLIERATAGDVRLALGLGDNLARERIAARARADGLELASVVHPAAVVAASAALGVGTVVLANAVVNANAQVGKGAIVNTGAIIEHDVVVGDFAHVSPGAVLGGAARLGARSLLGARAVVTSGVVVGARSAVAAGAVVVSPVPDDVRAP